MIHTDNSATLERMQKGDMGIYARTKTKAGVVTQWGNRSKYHSPLEWMNENGYISADQYDAGNQFRSLYYQINHTDNSVDARGQKDFNRFITDYNDAKETLYHSAMKALAKENIKYQDIIATSCLPLMEDINLQTFKKSMNFGDVRLALNTLYRFFKKRLAT